MATFEAETSIRQKAIFSWNFYDLAIITV